MTKTKIISLLLVLTLLLCLLLAFDPPIKLRFIQAQFNYLFIAVLYVVLLVLTVVRILLIEDAYLKKLLIAIALMLVAFPCLFVFSVALQNYYRVEKNLSIDEHLILTHQSEDGDSFIRTYKVPDLGFTQLYGFGVEGRRKARWSISQSYYPTKQITRKETQLNDYIKLVHEIE